MEDFSRYTLEVLHCFGLSGIKKLEEECNAYEIVPDRVGSVNSPFRVGAELIAYSYASTKYWVLSRVNVHKQWIVSKSSLLKFIVSAQGMKIHRRTSEDYEKTMDRLIRELKGTHYCLLPNQSLDKVFKRTFTRVEYTDYIHKKLPGCDFLTRNIPLEEFAIPVRGTEDIGFFKDVYAVQLSDEVLIELPEIVPQQKFNLEIVGDKDSFKFFLNYEDIIGTIWLFQNFKDEPWEVAEPLDTDTNPLRIGTIFVRKCLNTYNRFVRRSYVITNEQTPFPQSDEGSTKLYTIRHVPSGKESYGHYQIDKSFTLYKPTAKEVATALPFGNWGLTDRV